MQPVDSDGGHLAQSSVSLYCVLHCWQTSYNFSFARVSRSTSPFQYHRCSIFAPTRCHWNSPYLLWKVGRLSEGGSLKPQRKQYEWLKDDSRIPLLQTAAASFRLQRLNETLPLTRRGTVDAQQRACRVHDALE